MKEHYKGFFAGIATGFAACFVGSNINGLIHILRGEELLKVPNPKSVQQGFVHPNKLEILCEDLDQNGEKETIIKIGDTPYLLRDVDGKPVLSAYEIKPA